MSQMFLSLADFNVIMDTRYDYTRKQCRAYCKDFAPETADFVVRASDEDLQAELQNGQVSNGRPFPIGYVESVCLYRALCSELPKKNAMVLHAAVIGDNTGVYAFSAPSGTGKSTHIRRWREAFGDSVFVINGDKPILRLKEDQWWAYGTPWCGKEGWQTPIGRPLTALCLLTRGKTNSIQRISSAEAVSALMHQVLLPADPVMVAATMRLMDHLVKHVPLYRLACTPDVEAARTARDAMMPQ